MLVVGLGILDCGLGGFRVGGEELRILAGPTAARHVRIRAVGGGPHGPGSPAVAGLALRSPAGSVRSRVSAPRAGHWGDAERRRTAGNAITSFTALAHAPAVDVTAMLVLGAAWGDIAKLAVRGHDHTTTSTASGGVEQPVQGCERPVAADVQDQVVPAGLVRDVPDAVVEHVVDAQRADEVQLGGAGDTGHMPPSARAIWTANDPTPPEARRSRARPG
jgi:hypothetical protein